MKIISTTAIAIAAMALISCSEETIAIGESLTNETDKIDVSSGTFRATSRSIMADSVYAVPFVPHQDQLWQILFMPTIIAAILVR